LGVDALEKPKPSGEPTFSIKEIVPQRVVLTELARGFLLQHQHDPKSAREFAVTFLRERAGPPRVSRVVPAQRLLSVRRGVTQALREG